MNSTFRDLFEDILFLLIKENKQNFTDNFIKLSLFYFEHINSFLQIFGEALVTQQDIVEPLTKCILFIKTVNGIFEQIKQKRFQMSGGIFSNISQNLCEEFFKLYTLTNNVLFHSSDPLSYIVQKNFYHLQDLLKFNLTMDKLSLNILHSLGKNKLQNNPEYENCVKEILNKSSKIVGFARNLSQVIKNDNNLEMEELFELLEEDVKVVTFELSVLQKLHPLIFSSFLTTYLQFTIETFLEEWESETIAKSISFMLLKILKTYIYYKGKTLLYNFLLNWKPSIISQI